MTSPDTAPVNNAPLRAPPQMARVMLAARRHRAAVLVAVAVALVAGLLKLRTLVVDPDVLNLLPQTGPAVRAFRGYLAAFGSVDRVYVVLRAPAGVSIGEYDAFVDRYVAVLRAAPEIRHVDAEVFAPDKDWTYLADRVFLLAGADATRDALGRMSDEGLRDALVRARARLSDASPAVKRLVEQDPLDFMALLSSRLSAANGVLQIDPTQTGYVSKDGTARLLIVTPAHPPFDTAFSRQVVERLAQAERAARTSTGVADGEAPMPHITYAGGYHVAVETERQVRRDAVVNLLGSLGGILVLLLVVFRSTWLLVVGALPMGIAGVLAFALNGFYASRVSPAAAAASALLFGLGIDGLVLMYARYLEERAGSRSAALAVGRLGGTASSMFLGMATTAATFLALTLVSFPSLQELGRLIGAGMLIGGLLTLVMVPAIFPDDVLRHRAPALMTLAPFLQRHRTTVLWLAVLVTVALTPALLWLNVDLTLQRLQPRTPSMAAQHDIAEMFGLAEDVAVVLATGRDLDALIDAQARFASRVERSRSTLQVVSAASMLPSSSSQAAVSRVLSQAGLAPEDVAARLRTASEETGFRASAFAPFTARLPHLLQPSQRITYEGYVEHGLADFLAPYIARSGGGFTTAAYVRTHSTADVRILQTAIRDVGGPLRLTGLPLVNEELAAQFMPQFLTGVVVGSVAVFALILQTFRRIKLAALALLPAALGLFWSAGVLALLRVPLDLFSMFGVLAFIGIGVDYGIHLVHRHAAEGDVSEALARVAPVNLTAAGIAVLGCGTLVTSSYPPLRSLGIVSVVTLATCLAASLLVLPACLIRPQRDGRVANTLSEDSE
jgi:uncharacterized protein